MSSNEGKSLFQGAVIEKYTMIGEGKKNQPSNGTSWNYEMVIKCSIEN